MSVCYPVRALWRTGLFALFFAGGSVHADTANIVSMRLDGRLIEAVIPVSKPSAFRAALSPDGLVATVQIDHMETPPRLEARPNWPDPIAAIVVEKTSDGAKLTIFARRRLILAAPSQSREGAITLAFEQPWGGRVPERPIAAAPSWMQDPPPPPKEVSLANSRSAVKAPAGMPARDPTYVAALHGDPAAQLQLGTLCLAPESPDPSCARFWFERAALHGNEVAAYNLGRFAAKGIAGPMDEAEAAHWFQLSADRGYAQAEYALALLMLEGRGTPQDIARAEDLLQKAGLKGHGPARRLLDELKLQLSATLN